MKWDDVQKDLRGLEGDIKIDRNDLDRCMVRQPSLYFQYMLKMVKAHRELKVWKQRMEKAESDVHYVLLKDGERTTEKLVSSACWKDSSWRKARKNYDDMKAICLAYEQACRIFEHRREMLVNLGASMREELRSLHLSTPKSPQKR